MGHMRVLILLNFTCPPGSGAVGHILLPLTVVDGAQFSSLRLVLQSKQKLHLLLESAKSNPPTVAPSAILHSTFSLLGPVAGHSRLVAAFPWDLVPGNRPRVLRGLFPLVQGSEENVYLPLHSLIQGHQLPSGTRHSSPWCQVLTAMPPGSP